MFASISSPVVLGVPAFSFDRAVISVRFQFFLAIDDSSAAEVFVENGGSGITKLYESTEFILDYDSTSTIKRTLSTGLIFLELAYRREDVAVFYAAQLFCAQ